MAEVCLLKGGGDQDDKLRLPASCAFICLADQLMGFFGIAYLLLIALNSNPV